MKFSKIRGPIPALLILCLMGSFKAHAVVVKTAHTQFTSLEFSGRPYQLIETTNVRNKVIRQILLGKDRTEILTDSAGSGYLDSWEIYTPKGKMLFSMPFKGHFAFMEIESMVKSGIISYKYNWDSGLNKYTLYETLARPYKKMNDEDFIVGCRGDNDEKKLEAFAGALDEKLSAGTLADELKKNLNNQLLQSSCSRAPFNQVKSSLVDGLIKLAMSDQSFRTPKVSVSAPVPPPQKGQFLQCLRFYGMDVHASRIEAALAQYTSIVPDDKYKWQMSCSASNGNDLGQFSPETTSTRPTISMHADLPKIKTYIKNMYNNSKPSADDIAQAYARIEFHELLHYSLIEDETKTHTIEDCCGSPSEKVDGSACKKLRDLQNLTLMKQRFANSLSQLLPNGQYSNLRDTLRRAWGNQKLADAEFDQVMSDSAELYSKFLAQERCKPTPGIALGICKDEFSAQLKSIIEATFGGTAPSECRRYVDANLGPVEGQKTCETLEALMKTLAHQGENGKLLAKACPESKKQIIKDGSNNVSSSNFAPKRFWDDVFSLILTGSTANAVGQDYANDLCNIGIISDVTAQKHIDISYAPPPKDAVDGKLIPNSPGLISNDADISGGTPVTSSPGGGKTSTDLYRGPERPYFSNDSTARVAAIQNHIQNSDNLLSTMSVYASKGFDTLLPSAQADTFIESRNSPSARPSYANKASSSERSSGNTVTDDYKAGTPVTNLPRFASADPLGSFGPSGAGGWKVPAVRQPASSPNSGDSSNTGSNNANNSNAGTIKGSQTPVGFGVAPFGTGSAPGGLPAGTAKDPSSAGAGAKSVTAGRRNKVVDPSAERALKALLAFLQKDDYENVKQELDRPSVESSLLDHLIQVVDDAGQVRGASEPDYKLIFDPKRQKLILDKQARRPAALKK